MCTLLQVEVKAICIALLGHVCVMAQLPPNLLESIPGRLPFPELTFRVFPGKEVIPKVSTVVVEKNDLPFRSQLAISETYQALKMPLSRQSELMAYVDKVEQTRNEPNQSRDEIEKLISALAKKVRKALSDEELEKLAGFQNRDMLYRFGPKKWIAESGLAKEGNSEDIEILGRRLKDILAALHQEAFEKLIAEIPAKSRQDLLSQIGQHSSFVLCHPSVFALELNGTSKATWVLPYYYLNPIAQLSDIGRMKTRMFGIAPSPARARYLQTQLLIPSLSRKLSFEQAQMLQRDFMAPPIRVDIEESYEKRWKWIRDEVLEDQQSREIYELERRFLCSIYGITRCLKAGILEKTQSLNSDIEIIRMAEEAVSEKLRSRCIDIEDEVIDALCSSSTVRHPAWMKKPEDRILPPLELLVFHLEYTKSDWPAMKGPFE